MNAVRELLQDKILKVAYVELHETTHDTMQSMANEK